jgi:hypothetical protein
MASNAGDRKMTLPQLATDDSEFRKLEILLDIESQFGIEISADAKSIGTIGALLNLVAAELARRKRKVDLRRLGAAVQQILRRQLSNPTLVLRLTDRF